MNPPMVMRTMNTAINGIKGRGINATTSIITALATQPRIEGGLIEKSLAMTHITIDPINIITIVDTRVSTIHTNRLN